MQIYNTELYHFGVLGMKWGHRKGPSTKDMRSDRRNINNKEINKALNKYGVTNKRVQAYNYAIKNKLSMDDGGGGHPLTGSYIFS